MKIMKKKRGTYKLKIRWELLGLSDPNLAESTTSIESIRREVSLLASRGLGQDSISRSTLQNANGRRPGRQAGGRRRGVTE